MDSRLAKLGALLDSRNRALRSEAVKTLVQLLETNQQTDFERQLFSIIAQYSRSNVWEGRVAAAELLSALLSHLSQQFSEQLAGLGFSKAEQKKANLEKCAEEIQRLDLNLLLDHYQVLVGCDDGSGGRNGDNGTVVPPKLPNQRQIVDQHLDMNSATGVSSHSFITDDELSSSNSSGAAIFNRNHPKAVLNRECIDGQFVHNLLNQTQTTLASNEVNNEQTEQQQKQQHFRQFRPFFIQQFLFDQLLADLVDQKWHIRHGAALALAKLCLHCHKWLFPTPQLLAPLVVRLFQLLCLDRFCDFMSGSNAIAPVREATAQAMSALLLKLEEEEEDSSGHRLISTAILEKLAALLRMQRRQHWQCRQTALLVAKYHFAVCKFLLPAEHMLFQEALRVLESDPVDEVVSSASQALCSLLANPRLDDAKQSLVAEVMLRIWPCLECPRRLSQLREGVDSILVDFLTLLALWLRSSASTTMLSTARLRLLVELLDCPVQHCPTTRLGKTLECICAILESAERTSSSIWTEEIFFLLLKRLYRCVLFCSPTAAPVIIPLCQKILELILQLCHQTPGDMDKLLSKQLALSIGFWCSCLIYEHKKAEIDVFLHNIDGPQSRQDFNSKGEVLCGEEIHFLSQPQRDETILERKFMAARWLAPLLDAIFRWGRPIEQQPMFISVQLLFLPYLRSNSLYQKLGAALVSQTWALYQSQHQQNRQENAQEEETNNHSNGQHQWQNEPVPSILATELEQQVSNSGAKLYDEVAVLVNSLSRECNEFHQYCVRKGAPRDELVPLNQANSMEDAVLSSFRSCESRLKRADDKQALTARHALIMDLIQSTKLAVRTYTNRVNALFASALFHFANRVPLPLQLTPLIKPLMEALESESNQILADHVLANAFTALFEQTSRRQPCPHAKVLKQLANGLTQCKNSAPKPANWTDPACQYHLLSMTLLEPSSATSPLPMAAKARNCELVLRQICHKFGDNLLGICSEMVEGQCASLDIVPSADDEDLTQLEPFLLHVDFVRTILPAVTSSIRQSFIDERIGPIMGNFMELLGHRNPAVRFRIAHFLADITSVELCKMLKYIYDPWNEMISGARSSSIFARCGAVELLARMASIDGDKLLGIVSLLAQLALRAISDRIEQIRTGAAFAFRQLVLLLPVENRQKHFIKKLADCAIDDENRLHHHQSVLSTAYLNSFSLIDLLTSPGNLPKLRQEEIPGLRSDITLRAYQLEGITWLTFLHRFGLNGVLADDMGLGKTLQVLSLFSWNQAKHSNLPASLVICPRTLIDHWCKEWRSYFPNAQRRMIKMAGWKELQAKRMTMDGQFILIISYEELRGNRKLCEFHWDYVVLDEGHCIRHPGSQIFEAVCALQSSHRLILSGTPVQNSPADLWALFTFLMPGYLSTRAQFQAKYMRQIMACRNPKANEQQIKEGEQALQLLHKQCLPFVLRRLKSDVLKELPDKIIQDRFCELSLLQREMYQIVLERCSALTETVTDEGSSWLGPLQALHALRKLVDHPWLVADQIAKIGGTRGKQMLAQNGLLQKGQLYAEHSGKMLALRELLVECQIGEKCNGDGEVIEPSARAATSKGRRKSFDKQRGEGTQSELKEATTAAMDDLLLIPPVSPHRALIFCQWRSIVELLAHFLDSGFFGPQINYLRLDGTVPPSERQALVDRFNADPSIDLLLLTTHIGGVGLNLTGADVVIFVDHDWNPFRDLQAIDRAHRLGQHRTVNVYRLISQGTIEEKVMRLQRFKADTANALIGADNRSLASMASDELLELFSLGDAPAEAEPKVSKRPRLAAAAESAWTMETLWGGNDEEDNQLEQYSEQHSIQAFLNFTTKSTM